MSILKIPNFSLKAINPVDDVYVDEEGRHIMFRTINGRVTPIRTDSNGYASWLQKQGIDIDPADQTTLDQLDRQLEVFDRAREAGGPELQQQYQQAFEEQLKQREQLVKQYYQQALENQAASQNTTAEKLQQQKKKKYQENKEKEVSRTELPDRGWGSYLRKYAEQIVERYDTQPTDANFYNIYAFDALLMKALDLAQDGVPPSEINIMNLINSELGGNSEFSSLYETRYKEIAEDQGFDPKMFLANYFKSMQTMKKIFSGGGDVADDLETAFTSMYEKMYTDFNPEMEEEYGDLTGGFTEALGGRPVPENLPETFGRREASAVKNVYNKKSAKTPNKAAHEATLHVLGRLYDSLPEGDKVRVAIALSDDSSGLSALHKDGYRSAYKEKNGFGLDLSGSEGMDTILRLAAAAQNGTTTDKINAMKKIAHTLGRLDGFSLARQDDKGYSSHMARWSQSSIRAGRMKHNGPGLTEELLDDNSRAANIYPNSMLKVPDTGEPKKPTEPEFDQVPQKQPELRENEIHPGFFKAEGGIVSEDGYQIEIEGKTWTVRTPDGDAIGQLNPVQPGMDIEKAKEKAFKNVEQMINNHQQDQEEIEEAKDSGAQVFTTPGFDFDGDLTESEQDVLQNIDLEKYNVSTLRPGVAYRVSDGDKSLDIVYGKDNQLNFVEKSEGGLQMTPASQDFFDNFFGQENIDEADADETTTENVEEPEEAESEESEDVEDERTTAEQTEDFFEGVAGGVSAGARDATRRRLEEEGSLPLTSDASKQIALEDPNYNVVDDEIVGVRTEDGVWHGAAPEENSAEQETSDEPEEPKEIPQERAPEGIEQNNQRLGNVMSWSMNQGNFDTLMDNFDYEEEGIFWSYDEETGNYDVSMPKNIREEFYGLINRSVNSLPDLKL